MALTLLELQIQTLLEQIEAWDSKAKLINIAAQDQTGLEILKNLAQSGDKTALDILHEVADKKIQQEKHKEGFVLYALASQLGNIRSKHKLIACFLEGVGTDINVAEAIRLYKECFNLDNSGVETNEAAADSDADSFCSKFDFETDTSENTSELCSHLYKTAKFLVSFGKMQDSVERPLETALELFVLLAQGHSPYRRSAFYDINSIGHMFLYGTKTCPKDINRSIELIAEFGGESGLIYLEAEGVYLASSGDKDGIELLTLLAQKGPKVEDIRFERAIELFISSAQHEYQQARTRLINIATQDQDSLSILMNLSQSGDKTALDILHVVAVKKIQEGDCKKGFELYTLASQLGNIQSKRKLAECFLEGIGTEINVSETIRLYTECLQELGKNVEGAIAAEDNDAESTDSDDLAFPLLDSQIGSRNFYLHALCEVATRLLSGKTRGIERDVKTAVELLIFSAERKYPNAKSMLMTVRCNALDIINQLIQAYELLNIEISDTIRSQLKEDAFKCSQGIRDNLATYLPNAIINIVRGYATSHRVLELDDGASTTSALSFSQAHKMPAKLLSQSLRCGALEATGDMKRDEVLIPDEPENKKASETWVFNQQALQTILTKCKLSKDGDNLPAPDLAFRRAAALGRMDVMMSLAAHDPQFDINASGNSGCTALHHAALNHRVEVVSWLLQMGARDIMDTQGWTASSYAWDKEYYEISDMIDAAQSQSLKQSPTLPRS